MSYRLSILGPTNVIPLQPNSQSHPTSRITSSQSRVTPLSRAITRSSRNDGMTSSLRLSATSPVYVRDPPRQKPEVALLCSGQSCLQLPEETGNGSNHSDVTSGVDVAAGWRLRWRPLDVSEYVVSDFGFQQQLLSESLGMTQRKSIRSKRELERDIVSTAHRHISACQLPGAVKPSSRAATNFESLKESLEGTSGGDDWGEEGGEWRRDVVDEGNGVEWQRGIGAGRMRMRMRSSVVGRGSAGDDRSQRKRIGLCRGLTFAKQSYSSSSSSSSNFSSPSSAITSCRPTPLLTPRHHQPSLVLL